MRGGILRSAAESHAQAGKEGDPPSSLCQALKGGGRFLSCLFGLVPGVLVSHAWYLAVTAVVEPMCPCSESAGPRRWVSKAFGICAGFLGGGRCGRKSRETTSAPALQDPCTTGAMAQCGPPWVWWSCS
ncbi:protein cornichon-like protein [Platysternon megacephalum]|uniref:Protein cornichon-like protein n=1 Tax=Platysternon megacephalum TaxID=55544 RepID=A0A4D9EF87_9SAUR|nr:protein cornichon-like protein [Platysternon megacephalum]